MEAGPKEMKAPRKETKAQPKETKVLFLPRTQAFQWVIVDSGGVARVAPNQMSPSCPEFHSPRR
jgi:hypothetical protein